MLIDLGAFGFLVQNELKYYCMAICSENEGLRVERECECLQIDGSEATVGKEERKEELRSGTAVLLLYTWQKSSNGPGRPRRRRQQGWLPPQQSAVTPFSALGCQGNCTAINGIGRKYTRQK
jgi:hypothetical protein